MITCCTAGDIVGLCFVLAEVALIVYCPILKPWFGFRRPPGHRGRWFE